MSDPQGSPLRTLIRGRGVASLINPDTHSDEQSQSTAIASQKPRARRVVRVASKPMLRSVRAMQYIMLPTVFIFTASLWFAHYRYFDDVLEELQFANGEAACSELTTWIREGGGRVFGSRCVMQPSSGGRAVVAVGNLKEGETYAKIPRDLWFWEESVIEHSPVGQLLDEDEFLDDKLGTPWAATGEPLRLIFAFMYEWVNMEDSYWRPYLKTVPSIPTSPIWWDESQVEGLESPVLAERIMKQQETLSSQFDSYMPYLSETYPEHFNLTEMDLNLFKLAALHVYGRAFDATHHSDETFHTWALIPYIDLVNHAGHPDGGYGDSKSKSNPSGEGPFRATATECQGSGGELFHSYGSSKSATHYFISYGFIPTGYTSMDYVALKMSQHAANSVKQGVTATGDSYHEFRWKAGFAGSDGHVTESFIDAYGYYILILTRKHRASFPDGINVTSMDWEWACTRALEVMYNRVQQHNLRFSTSYEEDLDALQGPFTGYNNWVSLTAKTRYKRIMKILESSLLYRIENGPMDPEAWPTPEASWSIVYESGYIAASRMDDNVENSLFRIDLPDDVFELIPEIRMSETSSVPGVQ